MSSIYKVLVVEDNDLNLKLFYDLLTIKNYEIIISKNGLDIMILIEEQLPDIILMDIQLGSISGMDIIRQLKSNPHTKHIPIIVITAFAMRNDEAKILESGCDIYLSKPVSIDLFYDAINRCLLT